MHIIIFIVSKKVDVLCHFTPHFAPIKPHRHPPLTSKKQPQSSLTSYLLPNEYSSPDPQSRHGCHEPCFSPWRDSYRWYSPSIAESQQSANYR